MTGEPGESLVFTPRPMGEVPKFQERRIIIDEKTLLIPAYVQEKMSELDEIVAGKKIVSEIFGFGLTRTEGDTTTVVDFVTPKKGNVFSVDSLLINQDQRKLINILGNGQSLVLQVIGNEAVIIPNDSEKSEEWMHFPLRDNGEINWSYADTEIEKLAEFELPKTLDELKSIIGKRNNEMGNPQDSLLSLKSDWDVITTGGSVTITSAFINKVMARAEEIKADIGFSMHHHPSLAMTQLLQDNSESVRRNFYDTLLKYSPPDVGFMMSMGVDFFEIRALGNPDNISNPEVGTTSRFFRVSKILKEDPNIHEEMAQIK